MGSDPFTEQFLSRVTSERLLSLTRVKLNHSETEDELSQVPGDLDGQEGVPSRWKDIDRRTLSFQGWNSGETKQESPVCK